MVTTSAGQDSAAKGQAGQAQAGSHGRLLLLDGHSLAYRAFFALPPDLATTTGQPTNAVYGFTSMLIKMLQDEQPTHVAVAFDRSEPTFRHEQYVEYKANRRETPADFRSQLPLIFEVLDVLLVPERRLAPVERDGHVGGLLVLQHFDEHGGEAVDGVGRLPGGRGEVRGQREEGPVGKGVPVQQQEPAAGAILRLSGLVFCR